MVMETYEVLDTVKAELEYVCGYLFKNPPTITVEDSEDAPCVVLDDLICICYTYVKGHLERIYEVQKITVEHNYPHAPDWMDYTTIKVCKNKYVAVYEAIQAWVGETLEMSWGNQGHEQVAKKT